MSCWVSAEDLTAAKRINKKLYQYTKTVTIHTAKQADLGKRGQRQYSPDKYQQGTYTKKKYTPPYQSEMLNL
jgi:hypothetical protein